MSDEQTSLLDQTANNSQEAEGSGAANGSGTSPFPGYVTGMLKKEQQEALKSEYANDPKLVERLPKDPSGLFEAWRAADARLRTAVQVPGKDATDEDKAAYRKAIGVPDSIDGYSLDHTNIPQELYDADFEAWFRKAAHENNIPSDVAKKLYDEYNARAVSAYQNANRQRAQSEEERIAERAKSYAEGAQKLQGEWGERYSSRMANVRSVFQNDRVIPPSLREKITAAGLDNDPDFIRTLDVLHSAVSSDRRIGLTSEAGSTSSQGFDYGPGFKERYKGR